MKKCLHLKKTRPHWRRKPPKVVTWKDRLEAEKRERQRKVLADPLRFGAVLAMAAMSDISPLGVLRTIHSLGRK